MATTIHDIAKKAGVSIATVSRSIRQQTSHMVKKETRELILSLIEQEGYTPNRSAINLVQKKTGMIGLAIPYFATHIETNDYFASLVAGVMNFIVDTTYELKLILVREGTINDKQLRWLRAKRVDGIIMSGWPTFTQCTEIFQSGLPVMIINDYQDDILAHFVYADSFHGGYLVGKHFAQCGYTTVAITTPFPEHFPDMTARFNGFKKALLEAGISLQKKWILPAGVTEHSGYQAMGELLDKNDLPEAIFFINDVSAIGALQKLKEKHIDCPEQIALVGFDDIRLCRYVTPTLTTVHQPTYELGQEAAKLLIDIIEKQEKTWIRKKMPVELVMRESCRGLNP